MGHLEEQNTGHLDEREEVARGQEVAIMLGCVELDLGLC